MNGQANTAPSQGKDVAKAKPRVYTKEEEEKMKELVYSVDPWIAAWCADRLNEIKSQKANKESSKSKTTQSLEERL